ncbi:MAG: NAD-dependent epimerase/dehydratase family protein [Ferruginibacter sp.]
MENNAQNIVLVTGSAGLLGKNLIEELLKEGKTVRAIYNKTAIENIDHPNFSQLSCNILDIMALQTAMKGITELYHCAGMVSFQKKDRQLLYKINTEGTANVVNAALEAGIRKMVHVSSVAALGRIREGISITEKMQWTPETSNSIYGHSKFLGEMEVWRGIAEGLDAVIVNPVIILGAGNWNEGSTRLFKSAYEEFPWYTTGSTGFVDVRDVSRAMIGLMQNDIHAERFIISAENETYRNVFTSMAKAFGKKPPHKKVTPLLASLVWKTEALKSFFTGNKPLVTKETAATGMASVQFDNGKLLKFLPGFAYLPLQQSIKENCIALQQNLNKA